MNILRTIFFSIPINMWVLFVAAPAEERSAPRAQRSAPLTRDTFCVNTKIYWVGRRRAAPSRCFSLFAWAVKYFVSVSYMYMLREWSEFVPRRPRHYKLINWKWIIYINICDTLFMDFFRVVQLYCAECIV